MGKCKSCAKTASKKNEEANLEYCREYDGKRHYNNPERHAASLETSRKWRKENAARHAELTKAWGRNPEKRRAHNAVYNALRDGKMKKAVQECVGNEHVQAHHDDYSKPLDVVCGFVPRITHSLTT